MATAAYLATRKQYGRPQALIFTDDYTLDGTKYVPVGNEFTDFIVLSDHNRSEISMKPNRIEKRERMINGRMRSVWTADKYNISTSWKSLPSRAAAKGLYVNQDGMVVPNLDGAKPGTVFTADSGAGADDLAKWHKTHTGSFWVLLSFDSPNTLGSYTKITEYTVALECFFSDFDYSVGKRGPRIDLWDVSLSLEEA